MSLKIGYEAEDKAEEFLIKKGYKIVLRNFHSRFGEVDIIAKRGGILTFFEVKFSEKYNPIYRITPAKMRKIIKTIDYYFMLYDNDEEYRIDALLVTPSGISIVENITY